jgi:hypothetical protein
MRKKAEVLMWLGLLALVPPIAAFCVLRMIDPPWQVSEIQGVVLGAGNRIAPSVRIDFYKVHLLVKADDGRTLGVYSERHVPPATGTRITMQERVGLLGTRTFVEIFVK